MKTYFMTPDTARNQTYHEIIHACYSMLRQSIDVNTTDIRMEHGEMDNELNGRAEFCIIGTKPNDTLVTNTKPHFTIYNMLDHNVIRVMMQCCMTSNGPAIVDFIVQHNEEYGSVAYEFAIIAQPEISTEPTMLMPFNYITGYIGGALKAFAEFSTPEQVDPTENGDDGTGGLNDESKSN